jgi:tetratricopeptide (TPR) repeat protein
LADQTSGRHRAPLFSAALLTAALFVAAYANSWRNEFHFDDSHVIVSNPAIASLGRIPSFFVDARTFSSLPDNQTYRPIVSATLAVDHAVALTTTGSGFDPRPYHATQLLLLAITAALLGALSFRLFSASAPEPWGGGWSAGAALAVAALFAVHVANAEVGNYISARSETLSAIGVLAALLLFARGGRWRRWHLYLLPMMLGALAKTPAVLAAPLLLCWLLLSEEQLSPDALATLEGRAAVRRAVLGAAPAFVTAAGLYLFVESMHSAGQSYGGGARLPYVWTQAWVWVRYAALFFVPSGLSADTDWTLLPSPIDPRVAAGAALLALSVWGAWRAARVRATRPIAFGLAWYWIGLVPATVIPLAEVTNDHRPFFSYLGLTIAVVWFGVLAIRRLTPARLAPRVAVGIAGVAVLTHAAATRARNRVWATDASLWADVVRVSPANGRGLMNYGLTAMRAGRYAEALVMFDSAARLAPAYPLVFVNRAIAENAQGDSSAAGRDFQHAIALAPTNADAHRYYARWLGDHGRGPEALAQYAAAISQRPSDLAARREQLLLIAATGDDSATRADARAILALDGRDSLALPLAAGRPSVSAVNGVAMAALSESRRWYLSGWALTRVNRHAEAIQAYRQAVSADSTNVDAWNNLGWSLGQLGFFGQARAPLARAMALAPANALIRDNLAWVESKLPGGIVRPPPRTRTP